MDEIKEEEPSKSKQKINAFGRLLNLIKKPLSRKKILAIVLLLIILAGGGFYAWRNEIFVNKQAKLTQQKGKVVFIIEGTQYREADVKQYSEFITKYMEKDEEQATKAVFELLKYKTAAEKAGINLSQQQIKDQRETLDKQYDALNTVAQYNKWAELESYKMAVELDLLTQPKEDTLKGYSFTFWFAQHFDYVENYTPPEGYGNQKKITEDKDYAKQRADYYHDQLSKNSMTYDQALKEIRADTKLCQMYKTGANFSVRFGADPTKFWKDQVYYKSVIDYIDSNSASGFSDVRSGKTSIFKSASEDAPREETETYYYFVNIEGKSSSTKQSFDDILKSLNTEYVGVNK